MASFHDRDILADGRYAGLVIRYHAWPMLRPQSVGEHSWQMWRIYRKLWGPPSSAASELIMAHDAGEIGTGDMPLYTKRDTPELKPLMDRAEAVARVFNGLETVLHPSAEEIWRVKMCDLLEGLEHSLNDFHMGNRLALPAHQNYLRAVQKHIEGVAEILSQLDVDSDPGSVVQDHLRGLEIFSSKVQICTPERLVR